MPVPTPFRAIVLPVLLGTRCLSVEAQSLTVMTWNIRFANPEDGVFAWPERRSDVSAFILAQHPDILGIQEGLIGQLTDLDLDMADYERIGVGRDDGMQAGEFSPIYFLRDRFDLLGSETRWLSPTPDRPSRGWDAALPRIYTLGRFRDRVSGMEFVAINTHFDHQGTVAREQSARILVGVTQGFSKELPVIVLGDLNAGPGEEPVRQLASVLERSGDHRSDPSVPGRGTFSGFIPGTSAEPEIDHIFFPRQGWVVEQSVVPETCTPSGCLSDHRPVLLKIRPN